MPKLTNFIFMKGNVLLGWVCHATVWVHSLQREGGKQVLAGLAPSRKTVGSILRTPWLAFPARKNWQKVNWQICFNGKMHSTTF